MGRSYRRKSRAEEIAEAVGGCLGLILVILLAIAVTFGLDSLTAQGVLFVLGSFHVVAGFWQAFLLVIVAETIVTLGSYSGTKAAK